MPALLLLYRRIENTILDMQNNDPIEYSAPDTPPNGPAVGLAVDRSIAKRRATAEREIDRLVSSALDIIRRTGRLEPTVSEILSEAGLSNQAFYRHFRSKHELLVAVLDQGIHGLAAYLCGRMELAESPSECIREWIRGMAAQASDPAGARATRPFVLARGKLAETFPAEVARSAAQLTAPLRIALDDARRRGEMPEVVPEQDAEALYLLMMGFVEARLLEGRIPESSELLRLESFILAGLTRGAASELSA
jgi:AcrR family transcriptional regulator